MPITVTESSPLLPVNLTTALRHMRALKSDLDLVVLYLSAAVMAVEDYTGLALLKKSYQLQLDSWPNYRSFWPTFRSYVPTEVHPLWTSDNLRAIELRRSPLVSIDSIQYWNSDVSPMVLATVAPVHYLTDKASVPGRLCFMEDGYTLPNVAKRPDAVQINFTAGQGDVPSKIDPRAQLAVLMLAHEWYDHRAATSDLRYAPLPFGVQSILRSLRVESLTEVK